MNENICVQYMQFKIHILLGALLHCTLFFLILYQSYSIKPGVIRSQNSGSSFFFCNESTNT